MLGNTGLRGPFCFPTPIATRTSRGSVARTVLGVLALGALNNAMNLLDVPIDLQLVAKGAIIALALGRRA